MNISSLRIYNVRNHSHTEIKFNSGLNVFFGLNGSGKTTILESIAISGFSKSFLPANDSSLIKSGEENFSIKSDAVNDLGISYGISIVYEPGKRKKINSSHGDNLMPKDIIGEIPIIILSPDYKSITFGSPEHRRQFLDRLLSQASRSYIDELYKYRRALKQRNNLLNNAKSMRYFDHSLIKPWTDILINSGSAIILKRINFIQEFREKFIDFYAKVSGKKEKVDLEYMAYGFEELIPDFDKIRDSLKLQFDKNMDDEFRRGVTLFGPQKDDLKILINHGIAKDIASQGQHKSLLIGIKLAEYEFLKEKRRENPIILLDDIFSELDENRVSKVLDLIRENSAQTFITITELNNLSKISGLSDKCSFYEVAEGKVKEYINL